MKNLLYSLAIILFLTINLNALPSVAICGWDGTGGDEITFVLLRDYAAGEVIYFCEDEYSDFSNTFNFTEGHIAYTIPVGGLLNNEVVRITETSADVFAVECGVGGTAVLVAGSGAWSFSASDEIYAYSASSAATPWSSITEIHCFAWGSNVVPPTDQVPTSDYPNSIVIAFNVGGGGGVNADFLDASRVNTTFDILLNGANWSQSTGAITLSCTDFTNNMLPIELISFDARLRGGEVLLDWITATEVNNERFEIEHSTDGRIYTHIGTVAGKGTSLQTNFYQMVHNTPKFGINYYRLKQIDYDGVFSYSDIVEVKMYSNSTIASAYPNPFNHDITLQFPSSEYNSTAKIRTIEIYDIYGKLALSKEVPIDEINMTLDFSKLKSGAYFLQTLDGQFSPTKIQRIIKL